MSRPLSRRYFAPTAAAAHLGMAAPSGRPTSNPAGSPGSRVYDIRNYGAKGDGMTLDTTSVQAAIDACARDRGGTVVVPAGDFLIGTIQLKSNVTLHLSASAGSWEAAKRSITRPEQAFRHPMATLSFYAVDANNVSIEGPGTIDGQGGQYYPGRGDNSGRGGNAATGYKDRPHLLVFYHCRNLRIRDAFLTRSAYHCMRVLECRHVHLDGVRIHNHVNLNNDGFHLNSNEFVNISNCHVAC